MPSFPSIFCRFRRFFPVAAILLLAGLALPRPGVAQPAVYLGRAEDGRQLFAIDSITAALSPGDRLGPCVVDETGLDCPPSTKDGAVSAKTGCAARLRRQEKKFQARYLQSLKEYTENLRRKNYELVGKNRQMQELRAQLGKAGEMVRGAADKKTGPPKLPTMKHPGTDLTDMAPDGDLTPPGADDVPATRHRSTGR